MSEIHSQILDGNFANVQVNKSVLESVSKREHIRNFAQYDQYYELVHC
jgi:hypothetical protein